jgi:hypothetical protein
MRHNREHNQVCQGHLERKRETLFKREMTRFLHDEMRTNSLSVKIEEVVVSRLFEQWDRLDIDCGLSPTKQFSQIYEAENAMQRLRHIRCD